MNKYDINIEKYRLNIIYNILYENEFLDIKNKYIERNFNNIVYASAWQKGIEKIIEIFDYIININNNIKLILMSPGYDLENYREYIDFLNNKYPNNIIILGSLNKEKYAEIIKSSLCVLSSTFEETFGCVFSESYYLGIPVIADFRSGAVKEIIDNNFIVNYDNCEEVYEKILFLQNNSSNINIKLNDIFLKDYNVDKWIKLLL
jgi:glycosyltransferase involved in cell wall biosynthesis